MASKLDIQVNGRSLDLPPGLDDSFYVTKQVNDVIAGLESRQADYSRSLDLPATYNNAEILRARKPLNVEEQPTSLLSAEVYMEGVPILSDATILVTSQTEESINCSMFGGSADFFNQLKNDSIRELNLTAYSFDYNTAGFQANRDNSDGVVTADFLGYDNTSYTLATGGGANIANMQLNLLELYHGGFWFYVKTILEVIYSNLINLTVDSSKLDPELNKLAVACINKELYEGLVKPPGFSSTGLSPTDPLSQNENTALTLRPTNFNDPGGLWNSGQGSWNIPTAGLVDIRLNLTGTVYPAGIGNEGQTEVVLTINEVDVVNRVLDDRQQPRPFEEDIQYSYAAQAGDRIRCVTRAGQANLGTLKLSFADMLFSVQRTGQDPNPTINPAFYLPDISQKDFVINFYKWFNLVPVERDGVVTIYNFDEIFAAPAILTKAPASKEITNISYLPGYGQRNILKYADNPLVERGDTEASFAMLHEALPANVVAIELINSAADPTNAETAIVNDKVALPQYSYTYRAEDKNRMRVTAGGVYTTDDANGLKVGDRVYVGGLLRQVITVVDNKSGVLRPDNTANEQDWEWLNMNDNQDEAVYIASMEQTTGLNYEITEACVSASIAGDFKAAKFPVWMLFQSILNKYFKDLSEALERPLVVQLWLDLSVLEFVTLDNTRPIHIEGLELNFYINKIEQYKRNSLVRVELLRI